MGVFVVYILKSSLCLTLFYLFYRVLLSKETFHRFNRFALLGVLLLSLIIPLCHISVQEATEVHQTLFSLEELLLLYGNKDIAMEMSGIPAFPWIKVFLMLYVFGVVLFFFRNLYSIVRMWMLLHDGKREKLNNGIILITHKKKIAPFSWLKYVVISEEDNGESGKGIITHELVHIKKHHSLDLLLSEITILFHWFNPAAWLLKQELQNIHEYEADESVINQGIDAKQYQLLLIKKAVGSVRFNSLVNSFNHSKLKKRITMMLKEKSSPWARLKYLYILPLTAVAITAFARPEISDKLEEISMVKISDLSLKEKEIPQNIDTVKVVGYKSKTNQQADRTKSKIAFVIGKSSDSILVRKAADKLDPLIIIDGVEASKQSLESLDPKDIESMKVLKDQTAINIYGDKGRDGVILITSKTEGDKEAVVENQKYMDCEIGLRSESDSNKELMRLKDFTLQEVRAGFRELRKTNPKLMVVMSVPNDMSQEMITALKKVIREEQAFKINYSRSAK